MKQKGQISVELIRGVGTLGTVMKGSLEPKLVFLNFDFLVEKSPSQQRFFSL